MKAFNCSNKQEGGLALLNLMERLRIALLEKGAIGGQFILDRTAGLRKVLLPGIALHRPAHRFPCALPSAPEMPLTI